MAQEAYNAGRSAPATPAGAIRQQAQQQAQLSETELDKAVWAPMTSSTGQTYFYNTKTGESKWQL